MQFTIAVADLRVWAAELHPFQLPGILFVQGGVPYFVESQRAVLLPGRAEGEGAVVLQRPRDVAEALRPLAATMPQTYHFAVTDTSLEVVGERTGTQLTFDVASHTEPVPVFVTRPTGLDFALDRAWHTVTDAADLGLRLLPRASCYLYFWLDVQEGAVTFMASDGIVAVRARGEAADGLQVSLANDDPHSHGDLFGDLAWLSGADTLRAGWVEGRLVIAGRRKRGRTTWWRYAALYRPTTSGVRKLAPGDKPRIGGLLADIDGRPVDAELSGNPEVAAHAVASVRGGGRVKESEDTVWIVVGEDETAAVEGRCGTAPLPLSVRYVREGSARRAFYGRYLFDVFKRLRGPATVRIKPYGLSGSVMTLHRDDGLDVVLAGLQWT